MELNPQIEQWSQGDLPPAIFRLRWRIRLRSGVEVAQSWRDMSDPSWSLTWETCKRVAVKVYVDAQNLFNCAESTLAQIDACAVEALSFVMAYTASRGGTEQIGIEIKVAGERIIVYRNGFIGTVGGTEK